MLSEVMDLNANNVSPIMASLMVQIAMLQKGQVKKAQNFIGGQKRAARGSERSL